jgi:hypothetical protein
MQTVRFLLLALAFLLPCAVAEAQAPTQPPPQTKGAPALMVLNAKTARIDGKTLALDGVAKSAIVFSDRPARRAGYMHLADLVALWSTGSFAKDPPNATISAFAQDGAQLADAVIVLKAPRVEGSKLVFDISVLEGSIATADGPAALFIDTEWWGFGDGNGVRYLGHNQTTGGSTPSIGNPSTTDRYGNPNPAPGGPIDNTRPASPNPPPLTTPPAGR